MNFNQIIGLLGGVAFSWAAVPAAFKTIKAGKHLGTPVSLIISILLGTILMYRYLAVEHGFDWVITINYLVEFMSWGVLFYYRFLKV